MPLCKKVPESIYHIILHCDFVNTIWDDIQPVLLQLSHRPISDEEKVLGIVNIKKNPAILVRNWLTYNMREKILDFEGATYHHSGASVPLFKAKFNQAMASEVKRLMHQFNYDGKISKFEETVAHGNILCEKLGEGQYRLNTVFK